MNTIANISSLSEQQLRHEKEIQEQLGYLADIEAESDHRKNAINTCNRLAKRGYSEEGIADFVNVVDDLVHEYASLMKSNNVNCLISWLRYEIARFGTLAVANVNLLYHNSAMRLELFHQGSVGEASNRALIGTSHRRLEVQQIDSYQR